MPKKYNFALFTDYPWEKGRTPEWDDEENKIFNKEEDINYLNSKGYPFEVTKTGYYTDSTDGKYYSGIIYEQRPDNGYNYYKITPGGIKGYVGGSLQDNKYTGQEINYNLRNMSPETLERFTNLGLDMSRFFKNQSEYEYYKPNAELKIPTSLDNGMYTITYEDRFNRYPLNPSQANVDYMNKLLRGGHDLETLSLGGKSWIVTDKNTGKSFTISGQQDRGGGSYLTFPDGLPEGVDSIDPGGGSHYLIYDIFDTKETKERRQALNNLLEKYGLKFKNGGCVNRLINRNQKH